MDLLQTICGQLIRLHETRSIQDYNSLRAEFLPTWPPEVAEYLNQQWLKGLCSRWQELHEEWAFKLQMNQILVVPQERRFRGGDREEPGLAIEEEEDTV